MPVREGESNNGLQQQNRGGLQKPNGREGIKHKEWTVEDGLGEEAYAEYLKEQKTEMIGELIDIQRRWIDWKDVSSEQETRLENELKQREEAVKNKIGALLQHSPESFES